MEGEEPTAAQSEWIEGFQMLGEVADRAGLVAIKAFIAYPHMIDTGEILKALQ